MNRRDFLRTAGGAAGAATVAATAAGPAAAQEGGGGTKPDYGGWLDGVGNYTGETVDARGQSEVTIEVGAEGNGGAFAFAPPAVWVDVGTTVIWEWTGNGGGHNVHAMEGADFTSTTTAEEGFTFEQTFQESKIVKYQCDPHVSLGMKGAVAVGDDIPTKAAGGGEAAGCTEDNLHACGVPIQAHFVGIATILMVIVSTVFTFFLLKYGESPHAKGGN